MDKQKLQDLVDNREDNNVEFKKKAGKLADELSAIANSDEGGKILIGVTDSNEIEGIPEDKINRQRAQVENEAAKCQPLIEYEIDVVDGVIVVDVPSSRQFHRAPGGWYVKNGSSKKKLDRDEIVKKLEDRGEIKFDQMLNESFNYPDDFNQELFDEFISEKIGNDEVEEELDAEENLINLGLAVEENEKICLNNTAILMFGNNPRKYFPQSEIICGNFTDENRANVITRDKIRLPIPEAVNQALEFVMDNIDTVMEYEGMERQQKPIFAEKAVREAISNAVMHRDYLREGESIHIDIFPDKTVFKSPGGLPHGMKEDDLGEKSVRRNPKLAEMMDDADLAEKMATGIPKMKLEMEKRSLPQPDFEVHEDMFKAIFYSKQIPFEIPEWASSRQEEAVVYMYKNGSITNSEYRELFDVARGTAYSDLKDMADRGLIRSKGGGRKTRYELRGDF